MLVIKGKALVIVIRKLMQIEPKIKLERMPEKKHLRKKRNKMFREDILKKYQRALTVDAVKARNFIKKLDYKDDPYLLACIAQTYLDESWFNEKGIQRSRLYRRKWRIAERYIIKAFTLDSDCLLVLATMGSVRRASHQYDIAIYCFEKIIKLGEKGANSCKSDMSLDWEKRLINDSKFELYRLHFWQGDIELSKRYLRRYKIGLKKTEDTIYSPLEHFLVSN